MSTLHGCRKSHQASRTAPSARAGEGWTASSACHSSRKSRRAAAGTRAETSVMKRRRALRMIGPGPDAAEGGEALDRDGERGASVAGDLVVAPGGPLLAARHFF